MIRRFFLASSLMLLWCGVLSAADYQLEVAEAPVPKGIAPEIAGLLGTQVHRISGEKGVVAEIWFAKEVPLKDGFKPSLIIKYPFAPGQLMGAIQLPTAGAALDFRGQELPAGVFTLRYGQQPQDGNHLGTSDVSDFLLACPAETDKNPAAIAKTKDLFKLSAKAAGSAHPAIFLLQPPPDEPHKETKLEHDEDHSFWIVNVNVAGKQGGKAVSQPIRLVAVGQSGE